MSSALPHPLRADTIRRPAAGRHRGFTVIEMIVAMLLLGIGVTGAVMAISGTSGSSAVSRDLTVLSLLAQRRLAEAEAEAAYLGQWTEGVDEGDFGEDYPDYRWEQEVAATDTTDLLQITVVVHHTEGNSERTFELTTQRLAPPIEDTTTGTEDTTGGTGDGTTGGPTSGPGG